MRFSKIDLLAIMLMLFGASSASAFALDMTLNSATSNPTAVGDYVLVDIYLDAEPGLGFLASAILFDDNGTIRYNNRSGGPNDGMSVMPSYVLYAPGAGAAAATQLIPNADPPLYWGGLNQPGKRQVNIDYLEPAFGSATGTGAGVWLATVGFEAIADGSVDVNLTLSANGTIVEAYANDVKGLTSVSGSFTLPEPSGAMLAVAALSTVILLRTARRRS
jgi:hypothetical protein